MARPNDREYARLGVIVAKRMIRRAVHRNVIRRLIRESFRLNQGLIAGLDVVVLIRCSLSRKQKQALKECLKQQWHELVGQWEKD